MSDEPKKEKKKDCTCCWWCQTTGASLVTVNGKPAFLHPKCQAQYTTWLAEPKP